MILVIDSGGLSALAGQRARLAELRRRDLWPALVPAVVLVEALTGDHRRDVLTNRLLRTCQIRPVTQLQARVAARLRTATGRAGRISVTDAIVVAVAAELPGAVVLTSDPGDLGALAAHTAEPVAIATV